LYLLNRIDKLLLLF